MTSNLVNLASIVDDAAHLAHEIPQITTVAPNLTVEDAYAIQAMSLARRYGRGEGGFGIFHRGGILIERDDFGIDFDRLVNEALG